MRTDLSLRRLDAMALADLRSRATAAPRQRAMLGWHPSAADPLQRFFNLLRHDSYVRPHRHAAREACELVALLGGRATLLCFDDTGRLLHREPLAMDATRAFELPGDIWHSYVVEDEEALLFEVKLGPYDAARDKTFAPWAPADGEGAAAALLDWMRTAQPGDLAPQAPQAPQRA